MDDKKILHDQIDEMMLDIAAKLKTMGNSAIMSGAVPDDWKGNTEDYRLFKSVISAFCEANPYRFLDSEYKEIAKNIARCI